MTDEDFPIVGLTGYDEWFRNLWIMMVCAKFIDVTDVLELDREHWKTYYDFGYTIEEAFEEDLTAYGE